MAAPSAIVIACPHRAPSLRLHTARLGKLIPRPQPPRSRRLRDDLLAQTEEGRGLPTLANRQVRPATCRLSPTSTVHNDATTPTIPTTFNCCRQKRVSRHTSWRQCSRRLNKDHRMSRIDRIKRNVASPQAPPPRFFIPSIHAILSSCQKQQPQAPKTLTPSVAKNAQGDTMPHATIILRPFSAAPSADNRTTTSPRAANACRGTPRSSPGSVD